MVEFSDNPTETEPPMTELERLLKNYEAHADIYPRLKAIGIHHLTTVQYFAVLWQLFQGASLLLCAATSAGKTLVGEMACVNAILNKKKRCVYLVPLKSLANEKQKDFREHWQVLGVKVEMSTGDMTLLDREKEEEKLKTVDLLIATYERCDSILRSNPMWFDTVQVVVIDEIHNIGEKGRGARLEGLILRLKLYYPSIQFICLSATVGNPEELADWLGCTLVKHEHRPVPLDYKIELTPNRNEKVKEIVKGVLQEKGCSLVFTPTRFESEELCREISNFIAENELLYLINYRELKGAVNEFRDQIQSRFDQRLFFSIQRGVAFHHAGLSYDLRVFVETLFRKGLIKVVVCTPTLSSGVNMPAKVVIIKDVGLLKSYLLLNNNMLHQMCGRAGRPGFDTKGTAIILTTLAGEKTDIEVMYFQPHSLLPKYAPIESTFMEEENLLEQYLVWIARMVSLKETVLRDMTLKTFWYNATRRHHPEMSIDHLIQVGHYSLENFLTRHSTPQAVRDAKAILDTAVTVRQATSQKIEGLIQDKLLVKCYYTREYFGCGCGAMLTRDRTKVTLCRHLIKLAQVVYQTNPSLTKDVILAALHEELLIDKLLRYKMVKILNNRLTVTAFGQATVVLYFQPATAYWVRQQLPRIDSWEKFLHDLLYVYDQERQSRMKTEFRDALTRLFDGENPDLAYQMRQIGDDLKIYPGDMEEFVETIRWLTYGFQKLAELDRVVQVQEFAIRALARLVPQASNINNPTPEEKI